MSIYVEKNNLENIRYSFHGKSKSYKSFIHKGIYLLKNVLF